MRLAILLGLACACSSEELASPIVDVSFPEADASNGTIPFRTGGPFLVKVVGQQKDLGKVSHAMVETVSSTIPMDATATALVTLADQADGTLAGTASLTWPPGGAGSGEAALRVRVRVTSTDPVLEVPLEHPELTVVPGSLSNTGAQLVQSLCFDSTSTDGTLALHLTGAKLDSGMADGTVPLVPGKCAGALDAINPSSFARVKVFITDANVQVAAALPPTAASAVFQSTPAPQGMLNLELTTASTNPARGSIVDVTVAAKVDGAPTKDIVVSFQSIPSMTIVPPTAKTDAAGLATASFQMPTDGSLRVTAASGTTQSNAVTFWP